MKNLAAAVFVLSFWCATLAAASQSVASQLIVTVKPEAMVQQQGENLSVAIRLSNGAMAWVWNAASCGSVPAGSYAISASGTYRVSVASLVSLNGGGTACLRSTDGMARSMVLAQTG